VRDHAAMTLAHPGELLSRLAAIAGGRRALAAVDGLDQDVYLVGGAVRDLWLGRAFRDLDLVVVGEPGRPPHRLRADDGDGRAHERFGTATVVSADGLRYDLAAARRESYARPGALPDVEPASIREDLARRDFSVNGLALGLSGGDAGRLLAAPHGLEDMAGRQLRVLHRDSFRDDPTRLLRLARYVGRLGFEVEPETERLARAAIGDGALETVSAPRLGAELELLVAEVDALAGFAALSTLALDAAIAPGFGIEDPAAVRRALTLAPLVGVDVDRRGLVVLAAALRGITPPQRRELLDRLGLDGPRRRIVLQAAARAPGLAGALGAGGPPSALVQAAGDAAPETVALAGALGGEAAERAAARWSHAAATRLDIDGEDLIAAGVSPGPEIGRGLRAALAAKLDGHAATREAQLTIALQAAG
jgi:tRNA nucleotidyltransferase (CCA-adding enzyme)